jgi:hypothetical protein
MEAAMAATTAKNLLTDPVPVTAFRRNAAATAPSVRASTDLSERFAGRLRGGDISCRFLGRRATTRRRLANRRLAETFQLTAEGLRYTCTVGRFPDGSIAELFLSNEKSNSAADTHARDSAIVFSIALQCGADPEVIRRALSRDSQARPSGPLGTALDLITAEEGTGNVS